MKITNQNVPPALADLYADLVSTNNTGAEGEAYIRRRRKAGRPNPPPPKHHNAQAVADIVLALARYVGRATASAQDRTWRYHRATAILNGVIELDWWCKARLIAAQTLRSIPTSEPIVQPSNYRYPDPTNKPTKATYPDGEPHVGLSTYYGTTKGDTYSDDAWTWQRVTWAVPATAASANGAPAYARIVGTITISTDKRGSRPMHSLLFRAVKHDPDGPPQTDNAPPLAGARSMYWRYKLPLGAAPYYNVTNYRSVIAAIPAKQRATAATRYTLSTAVRPMRGRGYNNNRTVATQWDGTTTLYRMAHCAGREQLPLIAQTIAGANTIAAWDYRTGQVTVVATGQPQYAPYIKTPDGYAARALTPNAVIYDDAWDQIGTLQPPPSPPDYYTTALPTPTGYVAYGYNYSNPYGTRRIITWAPNGAHVATDALTAPAQIAAYSTVLNATSPTGQTYELTNYSGTWQIYTVTDRGIVTTPVYEAPTSPQRAIQITPTRFGFWIATRPTGSSATTLHYTTAATMTPVAIATTTQAATIMTATDDAAIIYINGQPLQAVLIDGTIAAAAAPPQAPATYYAWGCTNP